MGKVVKISLNSQSGVAEQQAILEETQKAVTQRLEKVEPLMQQINSATDAKAIADLSARIQAEQVALSSSKDAAEFQNQQAEIVKEQARQEAILDNLSRIELNCVVNQVLVILERAVVAGFISHDNKLFVKFEKSLTKKIGTVVADTDHLSISDIIPIYNSEIPIGFYFDNQFASREKVAKKFWFTVEELLAALYECEVPVHEGEER